MPLVGTDDRSNRWYNWYRNRNRSDHRGTSPQNPLSPHQPKKATTSCHKLSTPIVTGFGWFSDTMSRASWSSGSSRPTSAGSSRVQSRANSRPGSAGSPRSDQSPRTARVALLRGGDSPSGPHPLSRSDSFRGRLKLSLANLTHQDSFSRSASSFFGDATAPKKSTLSRLRLHDRWSTETRWSKPDKALRVLSLILTHTHTLTTLQQFFLYYPNSSRFSYSRLKKRRRTGKYVTFSTMIHKEAGESLEMTTSCAA